LATDTVKASQGLVETTLGLGKSQTLSAKYLFRILLLGVKALRLGHDTAD